MLEKHDDLKQQYSPAFSPAGRKLAFLGCTADSLCRVYTVEFLSGGKSGAVAEAVTSNPQPVQAVTWLPNTEYIVYGVNVGATAALYAQRSTRGAAAHMLAPLREDCVHISAAKQKSVLAISTFCGTRDIWEISLGKEALAKAVVDSTVSETGGTYSPDGRRIAFTSTRAGAMEVWVAAPDGTSARSLTSLGSTASSPAWSPDGRWIAFDSRAGQSAEIYVMRADGGMLRRMTVASSTEILPTWSNDGRYIYFASDKSGSYQIWRMPAGGGLPVQITRTGGTRAVEARDGRWLYFAKQFRNASLWRMKLPDGEEEKVLDDLSAAESFAAGQRGIYFIKNTNPGHIALLPATEKHVLDIAKTPGFTTSALSIRPDEQRALVSIIQRGEGDLTLLEIDSIE